MGMRFWWGGDSGGDEILVGMRFWWGGDSGGEEILGFDT